MTDEPENAGQIQKKSAKDTRFKPGQSGNPAGKPKGTRHKLGEDFLKALHEAWTSHGVTALEAAAQEKPAEFCKMVAGLLPKDVNVTADHTVTHVGEPVSATADWIAGLLRERQSKPAKKPLPN
jgi:hypothetical protein